MEFVYVHDFNYYIYYYFFTFSMIHSLHSCHRDLLFYFLKLNKYDM